MSKFLSVSLALCFFLVLPTTLEATTCSGVCSGENCSGSCTINSLGCSTVCTDTDCEATCDEYGSLSCNFGVSVDCPEDDTPFKPDERSMTVEPSDWALYEVTVGDHFGVAERSRILATSRRSYAEGTDGGIEALRHDRDLRRPLPAPTRYRLRVAPGGPCVRASFELDTFTAPEASGLSALFRVTSDERGEIVAVAPLHTRGPNRLEPLVTLLKERARLEAADDAATPLEAFVYVDVDAAGTVSYAFGGSNRLP